MTEFEYGYRLGKEILREECRRILEEWSELEKKAIPLLRKPYIEMTEEERNAVLRYETFWGDKLVEKACLKQCSLEAAGGCKKAIHENGC